MAANGATGMAPLPQGNFLFTSESVGEGHPDKLADQVSDAILDACLAQDPMSRVACEVVTTTRLVAILGEISTRATNLDLIQIARDTVRDIGYDDDAKGIDYQTMEVTNHVHAQSADIAQSLHLDEALEKLGAGDQGIIFGYATNETPELHPLSHQLAHKLNAALAEARRDGTLPWLRPDSKTQVTVEHRYNNGAVVPIRVHTIVVSAQHEPNIQTDEIRRQIRQRIINRVIPAHLLDNQTIYHIQPSGLFVIGGPHGDTGLTGRKIIVDTYGGWASHGGGAFSGKDFSKVDRSAAYLARWVAKSLVAAGLVHRCMVQFAYAIGVAEPLAIYVDHYGTSSRTSDELVAIIHNNFDLRPGVIVKELGLARPIYLQTAKNGHFGTNQSFPWEQPKTLQF